MSDNLITFKATGIETVLAKFNGIQRRAYPEAEALAERSAERLVARLRETAPVETGEYRDSIRPERRRSGIFRQGSTWAVLSDSPYAARLVFGYVGTDSLGRSYNDPPRHPWGPAIEMERTELHTDLEKTGMRLVRS